MYTVKDGNLMHDGIDVSGMDIKDMEASAEALTAFASYKKEEIKLREKFLGKIDNGCGKPVENIKAAAPSATKGTKPEKATVPESFPKDLEYTEVDIPF